MLYGDFGTTWTKLYDSRSGDRRIVPTRDSSSLSVDIATGHQSLGRGRQFFNELTALVEGGISRLGSGPWTLLDIGSRDVKLVSIENGHPVRMDWNNSCGALSGFTLELLGRYFALDFGNLAPTEESFPFTCGVLGMERLFDEVASGKSVERAVASFVRGMAGWIHALLGKPSLIYLSGGMCDNPLFLKSFPEHVQIAPLGRFVLLDGLQALEKKPS
jgi:activator of 2-hydroxyglutaryl-CoA dehydratase